MDRTRNPGWYLRSAVSTVFSLFLKQNTQHGDERLCWPALGIGDRIREDGEVREPAQVFGILGAGGQRELQADSERYRSARITMDALKKYGTGTHLYRIVFI